MKTEEIAEKAREYAYELLDKFWFTLEHTIACEEAYIKGYEDGEAEANAEWQEKVRWIPVEEKLPEYYHVVLLKTESYTFMGWRASNGEESFYTIYCSDTIMHQKVTHWREIIE